MSLIAKFVIVIPTITTTDLLILFNFSSRELKQEFYKRTKFIVNKFISYVDFGILTVPLT
jgi:hypothetical protein